MIKELQIPDNWQVNKNLIEFGLPENFKILIVTGTAGSDMEKIVEIIQKRFSESLKKSVSWTTRDSTDKETYGVDYYFKSEKDFFEELAEKRIVVHKKIGNNFYGTSSSELRRLHEKGIRTMTVCSVEEAILFQSVFGNRARTIFFDAVDPVDMDNFGKEGIQLNETLRKRLFDKKVDQQSIISKMFDVKQDRIKCKVNSWSLVNNIGYVNETILATDIILSEFFGIQPDKVK